MKAHPIIGYIVAFFAVLMGISTLSGLWDATIGGQYAYDPIWTAVLGIILTAFMGLVASCLIHPPPSKTV
jgi:hypothetical protein